MRIIAGKHRGRKIDVPQGKGVRPTSSSVRESVYNLLVHGDFVAGNPLIDSQVLDLFCGSGAVGLEALSRGAAHATLIDRSSEHLRYARANAERMGELEQCTFLRRDIARLDTEKPNALYNLVFLDPPYNKNLVPKTVKHLTANGWLAPHAVVVIEAESELELELPVDVFRLVQRRVYGATVIYIAELL